METVNACKCDFWYLSKKIDREAHVYRCAKLGSYKLEAKTGRHL